MSKLPNNRQAFWDAIKKQHPAKTEPKPEKTEHTNATSGDSQIYDWGCVMAAAAMPYVGEKTVMEYLASFNGDSRAIANKLFAKAIEQVPGSENHFTAKIDYWLKNRGYQP